jgi:hypothetical protein
MPRNVVPKGDLRDNKRYNNYRQGWGRIRKSMGVGDYKEVITTLEEIIIDRILSYLVNLRGVAPDTLTREYENFARCIKTWKKFEQEPIRDKFFADLQEEVDKWREKSRNRAIHRGSGIKSLRGREPKPFEEVNEANRFAAEEGIRLAKSVQNWLDRVKYHEEKRVGRVLDNPRHRR